MATTKKATRSSSARKFYTAKISIEDEDSAFFPEYSIVLKTIDAVNSFYSLYKTGKGGAKGPSTHEQQDLYRAMLVFACAGLDIFVKQLIKTKLPALVTADAAAEHKFKEHVKRGMKKDDSGLLNTIALALIDRNPRDMFLKEYIVGLTDDSLQSVDQLCKVSDASGLETKKLFSQDRIRALKEAFDVRNQIIHEMDINVSSEGSRSTGYRTRRQRVAPDMEKHTKAMLDLASEFLKAYKEKYLSVKIEVKKAS